jgi:hypothetical protein
LTIHTGEATGLFENINKNTTIVVIITVSHVAIHKNKAVHENYSNFQCNRLHIYDFILNLGSGLKLIAELQ